MAVFPKHVHRELSRSAIPGPNDTAQVPTCRESEEEPFSNHLAARESEAIFPLPCMRHSDRQLWNKVLGSFGMGKICGWTQEDIRVPARTPCWTHRTNNKENEKRVPKEHPRV